MTTAIYMNKSEYDKYLESTKDFENIFHVVRDLKGKPYLICHGVNDPDHLEWGYWLKVPGHYFDAPQAEDAYEHCVKMGYIKNGEHLNIVCCFGGSIKGYKYVNIVNKKKEAMEVSKQRLCNGNGRLVINHKNIADRLKALVLTAL